MRGAGDLLYTSPAITRTFKYPSFRGRLPLFDPISLLEVGISLFLSLIFSLKRVKCIEFCNENALLLSQQSIQKYNNKML